MPRINRLIELLARGEPARYEVVADLRYERGRAAAGGDADCLRIEFEHCAFDVAGLAAFMQGLAAAGPTAHGQRTPAVMVTLPTHGSDELVVRANIWMVQQVLATGVHALLLPHAETAGAVRAFVESARYAHQTIGVGELLGTGRRGSGGQHSAAAIWGIEVKEYLRRADPWPLNPEGELLLGVKVENRRGLANVEAIVEVPGIALVEFGAGDMALALGHPEWEGAPYPEAMQAARSRVLAAARAAGLHLLG